MTLATFVNLVRCLVCALLGLSYLSTPTYGANAMNPITEMSYAEAFYAQAVIDQADALRTIDSLEKLFTAASSSGALDPSTQFDLIRARVLTY